MLPDRVSNLGPLTYETGALPIVLRGPAPSSVTLNFNVPDKMFQMARLLVKENNCAKLFRNPCIHVEVMGRTSSIYDHFII